MPDVDVRENLEAVFRRAWEESAGNSKFDRQVTIVTPGRMLMGIPAPFPDSMPEFMVASTNSFLPGDRPLRISAVSYTKLEALMADKERLRCIPFLGHLMGFAYVGHRVVAFEGHPTAFATGVRGSDVLFVDSGMLPFLQKDWEAVAFEVMNAGARIFVHRREDHSLLPVHRPGEEVREPDGEASYVNCLLTTLAKSTRSEAQVLAGAPLPDLARIATDPEELEWVATLPFTYNRLSAEQVIAILTGLAKPTKTGLFSSALIIKAKLFTDSGRREVSFKLTEGRTAGGRGLLRVEKL